MKRVTVLVTALVLAACGDGSLFGGGDAGGSGGAAASSNASTDAVTSNSSSSANSGGGAAVTSSTSGTGGAGEGGKGEGGDGAGGVGQGGSGGAPPPVGLLECGNQQCPVAPQSACCFDAYQAYGQPQAECVTGDIPQDGCQSPHDDAGIETLIQCQSSAQCDGGQTCCADRETFNINNQQITVYVETSCQASCDFPDIVICDQDGSTAGCPMLPQGGGGMVQGLCQQSQLLPPGYLVCGYP